MRTRLMRGKLLLLFMTFGILLAIPAIAFAQDVTGSTSPVLPTIQSDKADYAPGELVTLTGSGWVPGESVNIVVNDDVGQTWNRNVNVIADPSGNISDSFNLPEFFVANYSVTATAASGTATTSFTDTAKLQGLHLGSPTGASTVQFKAGDTVVPEPNLGAAVNGRFYIYTVLDPSGISKATTACLTFAQLGDATVESYTVQANDPLSTSNSWKYRLQEFTASNCSGSATSTDTLDFYVAKATAYSDSALTTQASTFGANATAYVKVEGLRPSTSNLSTTWLLPNGTTACANTNNNDRPESSAVGRLPDAANSFLQYPPDNLASSADWNKQSNYDGACPAFASGNQGAWKLKLESASGQALSVELPVFSVATDTTAPTTTASATKATTPASTYTFGDWSNKDVTVTLNATDNTGGTGVKETRYTLDGTDPTTTNGTVYSGPFTVNTEGTKTLKFRSWDNATPPNVEAVQSQTIKIDKTNPTFSCPADDGTWHGTNQTFNCTASGGDSGLNPTTDSSFSLSTNVAAGSENNNASTDTKTLTDVAGNTTTAVVNGIKVDRKAPSFSCPADDGTWHANNQTFNCTANDGGSGLNPTTDSSFSLSTNVAAGSENNNASTGTKTLTDAVGNTATAGPITGVKVDRKAPSFSCPADDGTWHANNQTFNCSATDGGSGLNPTGDSSFSLSTNVAAGNEDNNASTGTKTLTDAVGNTATAGPITGVKVDRKAPSFNCASADGNWHADNVSIACTANDGGSDLTPTSDANFSLSTTVAAGNETNNASTGTKNLTDGVGNSATAGPISGNKVDRKAPVLTNNGPTPTNPNGANNWYITAVTNKFTATDGGSGFGTNGDLTKSITNSSGTNEGNAVKIASGAVSDAVGNTAASIDSAAFQIDLSNPTNVTFQGGPAAGGSYDFGDTPPKPSCTANDAVSGFDACEVTGYSTAVGPHTMTATAKDKAGRTATETRSYTVKPYNLNGFYQPIDMNDTVNTVKNGSTVPVKFELFKGTTELTSTSAVTSIKSNAIDCSALSGDPEDAIEAVATGGTSLRYDTTAGQFIYNWTTPKGTNQVNKCYSLTMTAADSSSITAYFKLK